MWPKNITRIVCRGHKWLYYRNYSNSSDNADFLCEHLQITKDKAKFIQIKQPYIQKLTEADIISSVRAISEIGFPREVLFEHPSLFHMQPITMKNRHNVLVECGFERITGELLLSYLTIMKQKTLKELRNMGLLPALLNIENKLASYMTQWPTSLTTLIQGDSNLTTLYNLRLKIIQRYLELMLDLTEDEFYRGIKTYPTIKHRPLRSINETLRILQSYISLPNEKIKSNLYLIHADPENLNNILYKLRSIGGMDIREVIRMYPKIATKNCTTLLEIKRLLDKHGVTAEAQTRCFQIYTLSEKTIDKRLKDAQSLPELSVYREHPRFLKMIHYNTRVLKRMRNVKTNNKRCLSLNVLSGSSARYETFEKTPGDRLGKGKDLVFSISQALGKNYRMSEIHKTIKKHPFWMNIPLVEVKYVCDKLKQTYSIQDIFENCSIVLYPWDKIREAIRTIEENKDGKIYPVTSNFNLKKISKSQKLSLALYTIEKTHYFSGNGVWTDEKNKNIVNLSDIKLFKQMAYQ
ncbi:transcription termination factor 5, mitochondrial-like [Leptidea sinapis]|uniref:transcription termination factor 5, mitochondrial-like n=1 Tax=Leptidea sinapis TaxID=189913 RepID=UPI0021C3F54D|nr:transcription termination factor 5, mitochondrial-like [Leptidea sinapis]